MKPLKFEQKFVSEILDGRKATTWRLFDDKNLQAGDELELVDRDSGSSFGKAIVTEVVEKLIKDLTSEELVEHGYENLDAMIRSHREYYGDRVNIESVVKMITFKLI